MSKTTIPTGGLADAAVTTAKITDANITTAKIADDAVTAAKSTGLGISMAQVWRLSSSFTGDAQPIASNLEAQDTDSAGAIGSAMTQSSGVFTFPSTGIYLVTINGNYEESGSGGHNYAGFYLKKTTNNSSYTTASFGAANIAALGGGTFGFASASFTFDVTDVSTHKIRFHTITSGAGMTLAGASSYNTFWAEFTRLGDT